MKRWGYVKGDLDYKQIAEQVFLVTDAKKYMAQLDMKAPASSYAKIKVMGKEFDPAQPEKYLASFAIKKAARTQRCNRSPRDCSRWYFWRCSSASGISPRCRRRRSPR